MLLLLLFFFIKARPTYKRVYSMLILAHGHEDAVLLQLIEVRHSQLVGLKKCQLQGARQEPDPPVHM